MITKYRTAGLCNPIRIIEVERETKYSVFLAGGRRYAKYSKHEKYWDSWEEARAHLLDLAKSKVSLSMMNIDLDKKRLERIKSMTKPDEAL